jgi:hypothetical protein
MNRKQAAAETMRTRLDVCAKPCYALDGLPGLGAPILGASGRDKIRKLVETISASLAQSGADPKLALSIPESLGRCDRAMNGRQAVLI